MDWGSLWISVFDSTFIISTVTVKQFTACMKKSVYELSKLDSVMDQCDRKSEFTESLCVYSVSNFTKCVFKCYALAQGRRQIDTAFTLQHSAFTF